MNVLEKEIEDMIWQGLMEDKAMLINEGLWVWDKASYHRQVDLGGYGICDILGIDANPKWYGHRYISAHIIEIKKEEVNTATFLQALRYAKAVKKFIEGKLKNTTCNCGITLVGKTVDANSDFIYLPDIIDGIGLYTYNLHYKHGITFQRQSEYYLKNSAMPKNQEIYNSVIKKVRDKISARILEDQPF